MIELVGRYFRIFIEFRSSQEISAGRTKCLYMSCEENEGQNHNVKIGNKSFENIANFR